MSKQIIFTDDVFFSAFGQLDINDYLEEIKAEFATLTLGQFKALVADQYLNDEGVSVEYLYNEFFPTFLLRMSEDFTGVADLLDEKDYEDYFEFLTEAAHVLFKETGEYLVSDLDKVAELAVAFNAIRFEASHSNFVAIAENDFQDYMREYVLELGDVKRNMESYVDWEKLADNARINYKTATISASNTLNYSGDVLIRA